MDGRKESGIVIDGTNDSGRTRDEKRRVRRRDRRWYQKLPRGAQEYAVEIGMVLAILLAIFLLVEPWDIRETIYRYTRRTFYTSFIAIKEFAKTLVDNTTLSDATAFAILLGVLAVAVWRVRWRIIRSERLWSNHCPRCSAPATHRIRRRWYDRLPEAMGFPFRRYRCSSCGWHGLRVSKPHMDQQSFPRPPSARS